MNSNSSSECSTFSYVHEKIHFDSKKIKLMTKIYNKDSPRSDLFSLIWSTIDDKCYAYGHNGSGCLGLNRSLDQQIKKPTIISQLSDKKLIKLCSGHRFVLALTNQGQCYSWGDNKFGQLGLSKTVSSVLKPVQIQLSFDDTIVDIACGLHHSLVLTSSYHLYSFGSNLTGAIGNGKTFHQLKPFLLTDLAEVSSDLAIGVDVVQIACGGWHSAAINRKGDLFIWGWNKNGQCGQEDCKSNVLIPTRVKIDLNDSKNNIVNNGHHQFLVRSIRCGQHHTLFLCYNGNVYALGSNQQNQCGQPNSKFKYSSKPIFVDLGEPVDQIGAWPKSDISVAYSSISGQFFIWGTNTANDSKSAKNNNKKNINVNNTNIQNQVIQKVTPPWRLSSNMVVLPNPQHDPRFSLNWILAKFDPNGFNDDNQNLFIQINNNKNQELNDFFNKRILITNKISAIPSTNEQLEIFNNARECDLVFSFINNVQNDQTATKQNIIPFKYMIFVQHSFMQKYYPNLISNLPKNCLVNNITLVNNNNSPPEDTNIDSGYADAINTNANIDANNDDGCFDSSSTITLVVNLKKKRFKLIPLNSTQINYQTFYSYLLFLHSFRNYVLMNEKDLIDLLYIGENVHDDQLVKCCLDHIHDNIFNDLEQVCSFYCQSVQRDLISMQEFCCGIMSKCIESTKNQGKHQDTANPLVKLYRNIDLNYDLELVFNSIITTSTIEENHSNQADKNIIKCHRLVLSSCSQFYKTLSEQFNKSEQELLKLSQIDLSNQKFFPFEIFEIYLFQVYHGKFPLHSMNLEKMIYLLCLTNSIQDQTIQIELIEMIKTMVTINNACEFYNLCFCCLSLDDSTVVDNEKLSLGKILKQICMDKATENVDELLCSEDFNQIFMINNNQQHLSNFLKELISYLKILKNNT